MYLKDYCRLSRAELSLALNALEAEPHFSDETRHLLRELQRHQIELEMQNHELQEAQQALEESRSRYADLYDFAPMACVNLDSRACIQELNLASAALLRRERTQLRGLPFTPFVDPADVSEFLTKVRRCTEGETLSMELGLRIGGARIEVRLHGAPLLEQGRQRLCRMALLDLTELRQIQLRLSVSERLATVGTLAAGVAHEINNPLAFLLTSLELATRHLSAQAPAEPTPPAEPSPLDLALKSIADAQLGAERIRDTVKDLGAFAHPRQPLAGRVNIQQVLELAVKMAMVEIRHRAQLVRDYADTPEVIADGSRLGQVFLNLLVNAAQSIPEGASDRNEIRLCTRASEHAVTIEIHDTGQGIPKHLLGRIFEPFYTTKPLGQGIGLGLAISHSLVKEIGGELTVKSEPGRGSVFQVWLPLAPARAPAPSPPPLSSPLSTQKRRVLIVDDERLFGITLKMLLSQSYDVTFFQNSREALSHLKEGPRYDAILCDLMMAEVTGKQFFEELSQLAPEQSRRVIFMTGGAFTPTAQAFVDQLSNPLLTKPFKSTELEKVLQAMFQ
jgi:PAS domain S-box-containing protein